MFPASRPHYNWSLTPCQSFEWLRLFPRNNVNMSRGRFSVVAQGFCCSLWWCESPLSTGVAKITSHWWMCFIVFLKNAQKKHKEKAIRGIIYRAGKKSSFCLENVCPGKLLLGMLGATFVAGRSHQSASNEDVQKLPYFMISSSQDGFLWFEAVTWRTHSVCARGFLQQLRRPPETGRDLVPPGVLRVEKSSTSAQLSITAAPRRRRVLWSFIQWTNKLTD